MSVMDLPIRPVEVDRAVRTDALRRARGERREEPFELDPDARSKREDTEQERREPARAREDGDQRIAPRASDEVGSHLDLTA